MSALSIEARSKVPVRTILGASDHPFALAMEGNAGDVATVSIESQDGGRIGGLDLIKLDRVMTGGGQESFVG